MGLHVPGLGSDGVPLHQVGTRDLVDLADLALNMEHLPEGAMRAVTQAAGLAPSMGPALLQVAITLGLGRAQFPLLRVVSGPLLNSLRRGESPQTWRKDVLQPLLEGQGIDVDALREGSEPEAEFVRGLLERLHGLGLNIDELPGLGERVQSQLVTSGTVEPGAYSALTPDQRREVWESFVNAHGAVDDLAGGFENVSSARFRTLFAVPEDLILEDLFAEAAAVAGVLTPGGRDWLYRMAVAFGERGFAGPGPHAPWLAPARLIQVLQWADIRAGGPIESGWTLSHLRGLEPDAAVRHLTDLAGRFEQDQQFAQQGRTVWSEPGRRPAPSRVLDDLEAWAAGMVGLEVADYRNVREDVTPVRMMAYLRAISTEPVGLHVPGLGSDGVPLHQVGTGDLVDLADLVRVWEGLPEDEMRAAAEGAGLAPSLGPFLLRLADVLGLEVGQLHLLRVVRESLLNSLRGGESPQTWREDVLQSLLEDQGIDVDALYEGSEPEAGFVRALLERLHGLGVNLGELGAAGTVAGFRDFFEGVSSERFRTLFAVTGGRPVEGLFADAAAVVGALTPGGRDWLYRMAVAFGERGFAGPGPHAPWLAPARLIQLLHWADTRAGGPIGSGRTLSHLRGLEPDAAVTYLTDLAGRFEQDQQFAPGTVWSDPGQRPAPSGVLDDLEVWMSRMLGFEVRNVRVTPVEMMGYLRAISTEPVDFPGLGADGVPLHQVGTRDLADLAYLVDGRERLPESEMRAAAEGAGVAPSMGPFLLRLADVLGLESGQFPLLRVVRESLLNSLRGGDNLQSWFRAVLLRFLEDQGMVVDALYGGSESEVRFVRGLLERLHGLGLNIDELPGLGERVQSQLVTDGVVAPGAYSALTPRQRRVMWDSFVDGEAPVGEFVRTWRAEQLGMPLDRYDALVGQPWFDVYGLRELGERLGVGEDLTELVELAARLQAMPWGLVEIVGTYIGAPRELVHRALSETEEVQHWLGSGVLRWPPVIGMEEEPKRRRALHAQAAGEVGREMLTSGRAAAGRLAARLSE
ncbi:hypothetical protein, partial [Streptomyces sp. NPDC088141]|uniref:hypothetical protein n=1 Tax=Streptomyces sp. NPDC088141 TaxID=3155179 RepID=UPI00342E19D3